MRKYILLSILLIMSKLSATELFNLKNLIGKVDALIKLIEYELEDCRKTESTIINEIKQVKESLNKHKRKFKSGSQNLEEIKKLEDKMESLFKKQSNISKKVVATEKKLKIQEDSRKKLVLRFERSERRASFIVQSPKANSKSFDSIKTENTQCGKKSISYQSPANTRLHYKKCFSPKESTKENQSLKDISNKALKDDDINQENTSLKHPLNKNTRKTISIIDSNADVTPIKQSYTRNHVKPQKNNSHLTARPKTNLSSKKDIKNPIKRDPKMVKSSLARSFFSNTSTPKRTNIHTAQLKPKTYIKPNSNVLPNTNSTALKNIKDSIPKTDNSQIENEPNDYEKINGSLNEIKNINDVLETNLSKESISPLVSQVTEKLIMEDGEIELAGDSTLDASNNLIEFTSQENVSKESNSSLVSEFTEKLIMEDGNNESVRDSTLDASYNLMELTSQENVSKESNSSLASELTEKSIMEDGDIESVRDSTLDESNNLIQFTSQENVTKTEYSRNETTYVSKLKNDDSINELNKSGENDHSKDFNDRNDSKKSETPVSMQRKILRAKKQAPCQQTLQTKIIHDFTISDKTVLVDDPKDVYPTTVDMNNGNEKFNEIKEQDVKTKIQHTYEESSIKTDISDNNKNTKGMDNLNDVSSSEHDINPMKVVTDFDNHYPELSNINESKKASILNSKPSESLNTEIRNEKLIDDEASDYNKETQVKSSNHEFKIICAIITLSVVGIVVLCFLIYKHKLLSLFIF